MQMCLRNAIKIGLFEIDKIFRKEIFDKAETWAKNNFSSLDFAILFEKIFIFLHFSKVIKLLDISAKVEIPY